MANENKPVPQQQLNINDNVIGTYAQITVVSVTNVDITIQFIFQNPANPTRGQVVSRVTMPRAAGEDLAKTILTTVRMQNEREKEKKDGGN